MDKNGIIKGNVQWIGSREKVPIEISILECVKMTDEEMMEWLRSKVLKKEPN